MPACPKCGGEAVIKSGHVHSGKQRFLCQGCGRQFTPDAAWKAVSPQTRDIVDRLLLERLSLRGIVRVTGVSRSWLARYVAAKARTASRSRRHGCAAVGFRASADGELRRNVEFYWQQGEQSLGLAG